MFKSKLINLSRLQKQFIMLIVDLLFIEFALWLSFALRLGLFWPREYIYPNWWIFIITPIIAISLLHKFGLYRSVIKYVGSKVVVASFQAITLTTMTIGFLMLILRDTQLLVGSFMPRSVVLIFWFISTMVVIFGRFLFKGYLYSWDNFVNNRIPTIIYGAGSAGAQLVESLRKNHQYAPIAFIDDDEAKHGTFINFTKVYAFKELKNIIDKRNAKNILLAIPSLSANGKRDLLKKLSTYPVEVKLLPSLSSIVEGNVSIENIRHVEVQDILGRVPVSPKSILLKKNINGKNILITGAGGSIGSELCRQIIQLNPSKIVLFDHSEFNLYSIDFELNSLRNIDCEVIPILSDVTNLKMVKFVISENKIDTIYHAAAYKHVPLVEKNTIEGVYNNAIGTYNVAISAHEYEVENMVLISTDKAVRPTNIMGASKRFSELILQGLNSEKTKTCFSMVRFGNVLDSAGSVVPLFRKQIKEGGPVTVTNSKVTRYFMSIPEAVQLVLQAGAMAKGGDVFVLDMGEPVKILDLAYRMINLSGLSPITNENPEGDIRVVFTGLRPGEKLYEELLIGHNVIQSEHPQIMQAKEAKLSWQDVQKSIKIIIDSYQNLNEEKITNLLLKKVEGFKPVIN
tara:strand:- start:4167 stop:6047 length:1881 start_codon:yes stop_codon:yes gene_type:complete